MKEVTAKVAEMEALLEMAEGFRLPDGWFVQKCPHCRPADKWGLYTPILLPMGFYPTRDEAFAAWRERTAEEAE